MSVKELIKKDATLVVRYELPRRRQRNEPYASIFLSDDKINELNIGVLHNLELQRIYPAHSKKREEPEIYVIFLDATDMTGIQVLETVIGKPGIIVGLMTKARTALGRKAKKDAVTVELGSVTERKKEKGKVNGMKFYELTETAHSLLSDVVAGYARLAYREKKKAKLGVRLLKKIEANRLLAMSLLRKSSTFSSLDQMEEVIAAYTPIAKELYNYSAPVNEVIGS